MVRRVRKLMAPNTGHAEALVWSKAHGQALSRRERCFAGRREVAWGLARALREIAMRFQTIRRRTVDELVLPPTFQDFTDMLDVSIVDLGRVFDRLEHADVVDCKSKDVTLKDTEKRKRFAGFERDYVHFSRRSDL